MSKLESFLKQFPIKKVAKGEIIMHQNDRPSCVYLIRSGVIKVYDISKEGEIKIISLDSEWEVFPIAWTFQKAQYSLFYYEAFTDVQLYVVPREEYTSYLATEPEVTFAILNMYVDRYLDFSRRINGLTQIKAEDKVLFALDFLCRRFGKNKKNMAKVRVVLPISQQEFSSLVGLTRETVSTVMNKLRRKGVVKYRGMEGLEINTDKIEKLTSI